MIDFYTCFLTIRQLRNISLKHVGVRRIFSRGGQKHTICQKKCLKTYYLKKSQKSNYFGHQGGGTFSSPLTVSRIIWMACKKIIGEPFKPFYDMTFSPSLNDVSRCQFFQHFMRSFYEHRYPKSAKLTINSSVSFALLESARKMLVKKPSVSIPPTF